MGSRFKGYRPSQPKIVNYSSEVQQKIQQAIALHQRGNILQATSIYEDILRTNPRHADSLLFLGVTRYQSGQLEEACVLIEKSIAIAPRNPSAHNNYGEVLSALKRWVDALASYDKAIRLKSDYPIAYNNRGNALKDLERLDEALGSYNKAISLKPDYAEAYNNRGIVLSDLKRLDEALASYDKAISLKPGYAEAYNNRGMVLNDLKRLDEALESYNKAINFKPDFDKAYRSRGTVLKELKRFDEALESYDKAISLKPDYAEAYSNRGVLLGTLMRFYEAIASFDKAISLKPEFAEAYNNLGKALTDIGELREALEKYDKAISLTPDLAEAHSNRLFSANYLSVSGPEESLEQARIYGQRVSSKALPKFSQWKIDLEAPRLRVGFVSGDLRNHPVGFFLESALSCLDRNTIEVLAFPTRHDEDDLTHRIKPNFSNWLPIGGMGDHLAADLIHAQGVHCLVDLSGHTAHNRLPVFSYKPAPVQVSWLGYFATTGLPEMDFLLGDPYVTPPSETGHFSEKVWQLPETYLCFSSPNEEVVVEPLPALKNGFITFGSFNNVAKMSDSVVAVWARVLNAVHGAKLFLKTAQLGDQAQKTKVIERFSILGISEDRLILEGPTKRFELLASYNKIDIALDPFPYPGGTTSVEALWMGVPVLTKKGDRFLSHVGESIAQNVGHAHWIAEDDDDYVAKAALFARDLHSLSQVRTGLRQRLLLSPLCDAERFARNFESAMRGMWQSWKAPLLG